MRASLAENGLKKFNVLIVEDDPLIGKLVADLLKHFGVGKVFLVSNGRAALELMNSQPIDFMFSDSRMEGMNGIELSGAVRYSGKPYAHIPIIMLTGNAEQHQVMEARDAGVTEYLVKPFTVKDLLNRIKSVIERPRDFVATRSYHGHDRRRRGEGLPPGVVSDRRKAIRVRRLPRWTDPDRPPLVAQPLSAGSS